jgi:hypothetical protein
MDEIRNLLAAWDALGIRGGASAGSRQGLLGLDGTTMLVDTNAWADFTKALAALRAAQRDGDGGGE